MTGLLLFGVALANPKVIEIEVPAPTPAPPPPHKPPPAQSDPQNPQGDPAATADPAAGAAKSSRVIRQGPREVKGVAPPVLFGRYSVVEVTKAGETEEFHTKMEREGLAVKQDCITDRLIFDFGAGPSSQLPNLVSIADQQRCTKGGFGSYASEISVEIPAQWRLEPDGRLILSMPPVEATTSLVRVRLPAENNDLNTPSHWLGPTTRMERQKIELSVLAEPGKPPPGARRRDDPEPVVAPAVIHLVGPDVIYHLEPELDAGIFAEPLPPEIAASTHPQRPRPQRAPDPAPAEPELMPIRP